jgi:hypothetical protein
MPHPRERHFLTEHDAHLKMIPGKLEYSNPAGNMTWLADDGFDVSTGKSLLISARRDVNITSGSRVRVYSPERISVCKAGAESSVDMRGSELHIKAVKNVTAASKANKYKKTTLPKRVKKIETDAVTASKLAAAMPRISNVKK